MERKQRKPLWISHAFSKIQKLWCLVRRYCHMSLCMIILLIRTNVRDQYLLSFIYNTLGPQNFNA